MIYAIVAFFCGIFLCGAAAFGWYLLTMIKRLTAAVDLQVKSTQELLGEGSFTRISKALTSMNNAMPDMLAGMKEFAGVMRLVFKANEETEAPAKRVAADEGSAFYPHNDQQAAINEVAAEAARQRIIIPAEDLARMHTDEAT